MSMGKVHVNVSVDEDILKKAKEMRLNVSGELDNTLRNRLGGTHTTIPAEDGESCSSCGISVRRCIADDFPKTTGSDSGNKLEDLPLCMLWDGRLERWICQKCSNREIRKVVVAT